MQKIIKHEVIEYRLYVKCNHCGTDNEFIICHGEAREPISKKELRYKIPSDGWNGWRVKKGEEKCPICIMNKF